MSPNSGMTVNRVAITGREPERSRGLDRVTVSRSGLRPRGLSFCIRRDIFFNQLVAEAEATAFGQGRKPYIASSG